MKQLIRWSIESQFNQKDFLTKIEIDTSNLKSLSDLAIFVDKIKKINEVRQDYFKNLWKENVTKVWNSSTEPLERKINMKAKNIALNMRLE